MDHYDPAADWKAVVKSSIGFTLEDLSLLAFIGTSLLAIYSIIIYFWNAGNSAAFVAMEVLWVITALVGLRVAIPLIVYWVMVALAGMFLLLGYFWEWLLVALKRHDMDDDDGSE